MSRQALILGLVVLGLSLVVTGAYAVRKQVAATLTPEGTS